MTLPINRTKIARSSIRTAKVIYGTIRYSIKAVSINPRDGVIKNGEINWLSECSVVFYSIIVLSHHRSNKFYRCLIWFWPLSKVWESRGIIRFSLQFWFFFFVASPPINITWQRNSAAAVEFIAPTLTYKWLACSVQVDRIESSACCVYVIYQLALINSEPDDCLSEPFLHLPRTAMKSVRFVSYFHADI